MMDEADRFLVGFLLVLTALVIFFVGGFLGTIYPMEGIHISNSTAHDICFNLTNNTAVVAHAEKGKLICELPSYDHVQSIIIRDNSEGKR